LPGGPTAGGHLPGLDPDADLERLVEREGVAEPPEPLADRDPRPHGPERVVLVHRG
jgi:hypothetical protein